MIRFLRQMAGLPYVVTGFWLSTIGDAITDIGSWIEGADDPLTTYPAKEQEESHGTPHAA